MEDIRLNPPFAKSMAYLEEPEIYYHNLSEIGVKHLQSYTH